MKPLSIFARAVPWGIPNTYNEVLMAGCLKTTLPSSLPMYISHEATAVPSGLWQRFTDLPEGLFVQGKITSDEAIRRVLDGELTELSINFADLGASNFMDLLLNSRDLRALEAKASLQERGMDKYPGKQTIWENMPRMTCWEAQISEISLVDVGAFQGTQFHIVGETTEELNRRLVRKKKQ